MDREAANAAAQKKKKSHETQTFFHNLQEKTSGLHVFLAINYNENKGVKTKDHHP